VTIRWGASVVRLCGRYDQILWVGWGVRKVSGIDLGLVDDTVRDLPAGKPLRDEVMSIELPPATRGMLDELVSRRETGITAA